MNFFKFVKYVGVCEISFKICEHFLIHDIFSIFFFSIFSKIQWLTGQPRLANEGTSGMSERGDLGQPSSRARGHQSRKPALKAPYWGSRHGRLLPHVNQSIASVRLHLYLHRSTVAQLGGRLPKIFITSQIFNLECYTLDHHAYHIFLRFCRF